jgi:hypothetical protein
VECNARARRDLRAAESASIRGISDLALVVDYEGRTHCVLPCTRLCKHDDGGRRRSFTPLNGRGTKKEAETCFCPLIHFV